jgi:hypothetical protein
MDKEKAATMGCIGKFCIYSFGSGDLYQVNHARGTRMSKSPSAALDEAPARNILKVPIQYPSII